ncbi:hypothetical protein OsI_12665 [Oryza sativa Indica Group]|uniref:Uncharacterized protein n=1 Tax=Oryza sativa subsp. indica TaxID=39946 RepID=B8AMM2_ORYSI|nr:hypothetical protein OsI_12665 [Oryza sativa Indica Group]
MPFLSTPSFDLSAGAVPTLARALLLLLMPLTSLPRSSSRQCQRQRRWRGAAVACGRRRSDCGRPSESSNVSVTSMGEEGMGMGRGGSGWRGGWWWWGG